MKENQNIGGARPCAAYPVSGAADLAQRGCAAVPISLSPLSATSEEFLLKRRVVAQGFQLAFEFRNLRLDEFFVSDRLL